MPGFLCPPGFEVIWPIRGFRTPWAPTRLSWRRGHIVDGKWSYSPPEPLFPVILASEKITYRNVLIVCDISGCLYSWAKPKIFCHRGNKAAKVLCWRLAQCA